MGDYVDSAMASVLEELTMSTMEEHDPQEPIRELTSDEETEDASEPDRVKVDSEESVNSSTAEEKIELLKARLKRLEDRTDQDYLKRLQELKDTLEDRLFVAAVFRDYELLCAEEEHGREKALAMQDFEAKKLELKECFLHELEEKKKEYDNYRANSDLVYGDNFEPKTMVTRKLRRRPYDPLPTSANEKRRKSSPLSSLVYILDENQVEEDLKTIFKGKVTTNAKTLSSPVPVVGTEGGTIYEARIEDGRLFYENRWFHKGQHIFIESKEHGQESGIIASISQNEIWVKRLPDLSKLRIYITQLTRGKYVLRRRSA